MKPTAVYILLCSDGSYYTGVTSDIELRLQQHETGYFETCYTYNKRPVKLMFFEEFQYPNQAIEVEKQVKGWTRKKKEALIERNWDKLKELAICKNETSHKFFEKK